MGNSYTKDYPVLKELAAVLPAARIQSINDIAIYTYKLSDDVLKSNDDEVEHGTVTWTKLKEIKCPIAVTLRVYYQLKSEAGVMVGARIYKNGGAAGAQNTTTDTTWQTYTQDLAFIESDLIQLYLYASGSSKAQARNFRILGSMWVDFENLM